MQIWNEDEFWIGTNPVDTEWGQRHRLLWTLRARDTGTLRLPILQIPLAHDDGRVEPVAVGGAPLRVRSALAELPEREAFFDIRDPPAPARDPGPALVVGGVVAVLGLLGVLALRHRRGLPVRGQRTHTNARTRKGPKKTVAGKKQAATKRKAPAKKKAAAKKKTSAKK